MRRTVLLLASAALAVLLASGVALAATISCPNRAENLCVGTDQADTMNGRDGASDDMRGRGGADTLRGRRASDMLTGGSGNDFLAGAQGSDTYRFASGWGRDTIGFEPGGKDTLDFSAVSGTVRVTLDPNSGLPEATAGTNTLDIRAEELTLIENVRGGARRDRISGNRAANILLGNAGEDALYGSGGKDTLKGGAANDGVSGGLGDDQINGGEGNDVYSYEEPAWGHDTITDTDDLTATNGMYFNANFAESSPALTINLVSNSGAPEVYYTGSPSGPNTMEWSNSVIDRIFSLAGGDDTIVGNASSNEIESTYGADTISTRAGDDYIDVDDDFVGGASGDTVDCGGTIIADTDTVYYNDGDTVINCEIRYKDGVLQP